MTNSRTIEWKIDRDVYLFMNRRNDIDDDLRKTKVMINIYKHWQFEWNHSKTAKVFQRVAFELDINIQKSEQFERSCEKRILSRINENYVKT